MSWNISRMIAALCLAMPAVAALAWQSPKQDRAPAMDLEAAGHLFEENCSACHVAADPTFASDRAWIGQLRETAWTDTPKAARAALIEYFNAPKLARPKLAARADGNGAVIRADFEEGSLFLRDKAGEVTRLAWEARGKAELEKGVAYSLPAGVYTLVGFRVFDRSRENEVWHISGTGSKLQRIEIPAQGEVELKISRAISLKQRFDGSSAGMEIRGAFAAGVSIYKNGARIPVGYRVLDAQGVELTKGAMNYGWGGGGWASVKPAHTNAQLELLFDAPPFELKRGEL